jgi:hypothetical protein
MVEFLGLDYWKQVEGVANGDEEFGIKARGFTASFTFRVTDKDLPAVYVMFEDGKVTELREHAPVQGEHERHHPVQQGLPQALPGHAGSPGRVLDQFPVARFTFLSIAS